MSSITESRTGNTVLTPGTRVVTQSFENGTVIGHSHGYSRTYVQVKMDTDGSVREYTSHSLNRLNLTA